MTAVRIVLTLVGSAIAAASIVAVLALATTALAVATGSSTGIPGLIAVTAGEGADLAFARFISPGSAIWFALLAVGVTAASAATSRMKTRRPTTTGVLGQP